MAVSVVSDERASKRRDRALMLAAEIALLITPNAVPDPTPVWVFASCYGAAGVLAIYAIASWWWSRRYWNKPRNGIGVYLALRMNEQLSPGRCRFYTIYYSDKVSFSIFLTASRNLAAEITDLYGEKYTLEVKTGKKGVPWLSWFTVAAEFSHEASCLRIRLMIDGNVVGERDFPISIQFGDGEWGVASTLGARDGDEYGHFTVGVIIWRGLEYSNVAKARKSFLLLIKSKIGKGGLYFNNAEMGYDKRKQVRPPSKGDD